MRNLEDCEKRPTFAVAFEEGAAQVAELVDALVSGTSNSNVVQVRFLSWARIVVFVSLFDVLPRWWNW